MAELVDAMVSNTIGEILPGSIPGRGTATKSSSFVFKTMKSSFPIYRFRVRPGQCIFNKILYANISQQRFLPTKVM